MSKRTFSIFALICAFSIAASAQIKQISSNEIYTARNAAYKMNSEHSVRIVRTTETFEGDSIAKTVTVVQERLLPDNRSRFVLTEKTSDKETRFESIEIGYMRYTRRDDEPWTAKDLRGSGNGSGTGTGVVNASCRQYTEEAVFVGNSVARKLRDFNVDKTNEGLTFKEEIAWFDSNSGAFLREESISGLLDPRIIKTQSITTYEYDPNIKIEAPIKDAAGKPNN